MELEGKVAVVTGGAGGIGSALARRFHAGGAKAVVVLDRDGEGAQAVAGPLEAERPGSALGAACDVSVEAEVVALLDHVEATFGPVDLFCANAGVGIGTDLETSDADWRTALDVNFMAHLYAARALVPSGSSGATATSSPRPRPPGCSRRSAPAPYAVSKHAAVAFAEWLAVTYGDRGLKVSCLCPMGVNTAMLNPPGGARAASRRWAATW